MSNADFTPVFRGYSGQKEPFKFWCQTVLPLTYDDSLSYYELLCKVVKYLNNCISDIVSLVGNSQALLESYEALQNYVNEYFDNLDVQEEINAKLDLMAVDGTLTNLIRPMIGPAVEAYLAEHLTDTTPPVDDTLSIRGAAADSYTVGQKFLSVDEYGSVFETQNKLWKHNKFFENRPEYEFHFCNYDIGRWYLNNGVLTKTTTTGYNTSNNPVDVVDSMVLHIPANEGYNANSSVGFCLGEMVDGNFVPRFYHGWSTANTGKNVTIRYYKNEYMTLNNPKIVLQTGGNSELLDGLVLKRKHITKDYGFRRVLITNSNIGAFVPAHTSDGKPSPTDGRLCNFYSSLCVRKSSTASTVGTQNVTINPLDSDHYLGVWQVQKSGSVISSYSVNPDHSISLNTPLADGESCIYHYVVADAAPVKINKWHKFLYADGLPLDAIFYDKYGAQIYWYNGQNSVSGCLNYMAGHIYPSIIEIPENAVSMHFAVYGTSTISNVSTNQALGNVLAEYADKICCYGHTDHTPIYNQQSGNAISNAIKLLDMKYDAEVIPTRYHVFGNGENTKQVAIGFPYAQDIRFMVGTHISYYTYLSLYRKSHGLSAYSSWSFDYNSNAGFMCAAFVSACLGFKHYEGAEYFITKYADKLVKVTSITDVRPGDILVTTKYYRPRSALKPGRNLNTHVSFITDVLYDREGGAFIGYTVDENSNVWSRRATWKLKDLVATISDAQREYTENPDNEPVGGDRVCEAFTWRLRMSFDEVPDIKDSYRFTKDIALDPVNNTDVEIPPVVSALGDCCIVGDYPYLYNGVTMGYRSPTIGYNFYVEKEYPYINIYKNVGGGDNFTKIADQILVGNSVTKAGYSYHSIDLSQYMEEPGLYQIECLDSSYNPHPLRGKFIVPNYPNVVSISGDGKKIELPGMYKHGDKVGIPDFDEIWVRVIPYPAQDVDGYGDLPWANYMYVPATEVWDELNHRIDLGDKYYYASAITLINNDYSGVTFKFYNDDKEPTIDDDDGDDNEN